MCDAISADIESAENGASIARWVPSSAAMRTLVELVAAALLKIPDFSGGLVLSTRKPLPCLRRRRCAVTPDAIQAGISASAHIALAVTSSSKWEGLVASSRVAAATATRQRRLALQRNRLSSADEDLLPESRRIGGGGTDRISVQRHKHISTVDGGGTDHIALQRHEPLSTVDDLHLRQMASGSRRLGGATIGIALTSMIAPSRADAMVASAFRRGKSDNEPWVELVADSEVAESRSGIQ